MKYLLFILLVFLFTACEALLPRNWDSSPDRVSFCVMPEKDDTFREIRIYGKEVVSGKVVTFDSTIFNAKNWDGTYDTFRRDRGVCMSFFADSLLQIKSGWFEAVALRKDSVLLEQRFGQIWNGDTHRDYEIILIEPVILVEER